MRIIFVQPTGDRAGHFGLYTSKLCQALAENGHDVLVCTSRLCPEPFLAAPRRFRVWEMPGRTFAFAGRDNAGRRFAPANVLAYLFNSWRVTAEGLRLARRYQADVVHVSGAEYGILSLLALFRRCRCPVVTELSAANFGFAHYPGPAPIRMYKSLQRRLLRRALGPGIQGITIWGDVLANQLRIQLDLDGRVQTQVIYDGGDAPPAPLDRATARARLAWPQEVPTFLFVGLLRRDKGWPVLLEAMAALRGQPCRLVLAGQPVECVEADVHAAISRLGLHDCVSTRLEFLSEEQLAWHFYASDGVVLPYTSLYSGGSGPFLRGACRHQRAVVATRVADMGALIATHDCGLLCPPGDPAALAAALRDFLNLAPERRQQMALNGYNLANRHSWSHMAAALGGLYERLPPPAC